MDFSLERGGGKPNFSLAKKKFFILHIFACEKINTCKTSFHKETQRMAKKATKKTAKAKKTTKTKAKRKPNAAFMKAMTPSDSLAVVVGAKPLPRTEVTKKLWAYIKKKGLQDPKAKRNIHADDALKPIFNGKKVVNMFEMTKLVNKHLS